MPFAKKRILVCDDNGVLRRAICRGLQAAGYAVTQADDATEAARLVIDAEQPCETFDAIVLDYFMRPPSITGGEAANLIRGHCPDQPVVFISGAELPDDISRGEVFLLKPVTIQQLVETIERLLRSKADTQPPGPPDPPLPTKPENDKP
jgi:CheY-like chemotaxis protein